MKTFQSVKYWIFDLDNTLYSGKTKVFEQVDKKMSKYISNKLNVTIEEAKKIQKNYFHEYNTTLNGMIKNHKINADEFLEFVHDIDIDFLKKDLKLNEELKKLDGKKIVFTNAATNYALKVLEQLGIRHHFDGVFDIADADFVPKPEPAVYDMVINHFGINPRSAVMVEDIVRNLRPAADRGMKTVWVMTDRPWALADAETSKPDFTTTDLSAWLAEVVEP